MSTYNKATIIGRLGTDPELKDAGSTKVTNLSIATSEQWKDKQGNKQEKTEWHRVVLWGRLAEIAAQYLQKGDLALFEGPLETREWTDKENNKRWTTEIKALSMKMLNSKQDSGAAKIAPQSAQSIPAEAVDAEDDLPF